MIYDITMAIHGYYDVEIEADNFDDAIKKAEDIFIHADFGDLSECDMEIIDVD